ncbi:potassium channel family protein [Anoxynatronum buryatiense]|uniref:Trk system potassium uptake protein TrkA n=1 Tax=Anoxynatronum buryatiense TaxID=489973 RepID=A0AA45WVS5_9CLOT|nr:TrkA family potassium uptake protein [Anoxynatronum buryatiense]SMP55142.1 trk system potassium uptake protein TrkA [Anoxynatronum buryatiense]
MNIFVVGGGIRTHFLAKSMISKGHELTLIEEEPEVCDRLARNHQALVIQGDGTRPYLLQDAGITRCDLILALTSKDPDNLVICQLASKVYGVPKSMALVNDPANRIIFQKLGVQMVVSTVEIITDLIEQRLFLDDISNLSPIEEGKVSLMEIELKVDDLVVGKTIQAASFPAQSNIGCVLRGQEAIIPGGATRLEAGDRLIIICLPKYQSEVLKTIRGRLT